MVEEGTGLKCAQSGVVIRNYDDTARDVRPADIKRDQSEIVETSTVNDSQSDKMKVIEDKDSLYQQNSEFNERIINHARTLSINFIMILSCCIVLKTF